MWRQMARRSDIDWEAVESDYRAGQLSVSAVAAKHGVSLSQVKARAKRDSWVRDLSKAISERAQAKIAAIDVAALIEQSATESADKSAKLIKSAIEQASDVAAGVIVRHRADIRLAQERAQAIEALLDQHIDSAKDLADVVRATQAYKSMVDARAKLMDKEREAFNLGTTQDDPVKSAAEGAAAGAVKALPGMDALRTKFDAVLGRG